MNAKQLLEEYLVQHPDYWEYENEVQEVRKLMALCQQETNESGILQ